MGAGTGGFAGPTSPEVQDAMGLSLNWHDGGGEGAGQMRAVISASLAVAAGLARHVLVYRTVTEGSAQGTGGRQGIGGAVAGAAACRASAASCSGPCRSARCRRPTGWPWWRNARMHEFGLTREQLGCDPDQQPGQRRAEPEGDLPRAR